MTPDSSRAELASGPRARYSAPAAACAADVLLLLAHERRPLSVPEIARTLEASRSLVFRVARELESRGFVKRTVSQKFELGLGALEVGGAYAANADYAESTRRIVHDLAWKIGETVHLGVLRGSDVLYLMNQEAPNSIVTISYVGSRLPANCTALGKALLAQLPDDEVERCFRGEYPRLTSRSITSFPELKRELDRVREVGYATLDMEAIVGRCAIAICVDIVGLGERAALAVSGEAEGFFERRAELIEALHWARDRLAREGVGRSAINGDVLQAREPWSQATSGGLAQ